MTIERKLAFILSVVPRNTPDWIAANDYMGWLMFTSEAEFLAAAAEMQQPVEEIIEAMFRRAAG